MRLRTQAFVQPSHSRCIVASGHLKSPHLRQLGTLRGRNPRSSELPLRGLCSLFCQILSRAVKIDQHKQRHILLYYMSCIDATQEQVFTNGMRRRPLQAPGRMEQAN